MRSGLVEVVDFRKCCRVVAKVVKFRQGPSNSVKGRPSCGRIPRILYQGGRIAVKVVGSRRRCRILWDAVNFRKSCQMFVKGWLVDVVKLVEFWQG